ncbi:MAG: Calx-beta domain-containing protein [Desulfobulbaceae bacterium]|nr:Calx-beta domain-containing protein [Desulfobulbaceae bacterium]
MKKSILCLAFVLLAQITSAAVVDAPHNTISCTTCHSYSLWWQYSPTTQSPAPDDHSTIVNTVCMICHKIATGSVPKALTHSSTIIDSSLHGIWGVGCTSCHNPHYQEQLNWIGTSSEPYLVTGTISTSTYDSHLDQSTISYSNATENQNWPPDGAFDTDQDWGNKSLTTPNRGLILVHDSTRALNTFSILSATPSQITIQGELSAEAVDPTYVNPQTHLHNSATSNTFGLIYGQLIKDRIAAKPVKFFEPTGGFVEEGTGTTGICQVCHNETSHFSSSGVLPSGSDSHNGRASGNCTSCHQHSAGFKGNGHDNTSFAWAGNCRLCHDPNSTMQSIAAEIHGRSCGLCHVAPAGGGPRKIGDAVNGIDGSALEATNASSCVDCHLTKLSLKGGDIHHQSAHNYAADGNCTECHQDAPGKLAANHSTLVETDNACNSCHTATAGTTTGIPLSNEDHKVHDACTACHETNGQLKAAYGKASAIPSGGGTCSTCHGSYFSQHSHGHVFVTVATCLPCHTATTAPYTYSNQVHSPSGCQTCHSATTGTLISLAAGKSSGANCQTCHTLGHDTTTDHNHRQPDSTCAVCHTTIPEEIDAVHKNDCLTCHAYTGTKLNPITVADAIATGKGPSGTDVTCQTCHTGEHKVIVSKASAMNYLIYKPGEPFGTNCIPCHAPSAADPAHNNLQTISPCASCHGGSNGDFNAIWLAHRNDCLKCHFSSKSEVQAAIAAGREYPGIQVNCQTCHGSTKHTDTAADHNHRVTISSCASCHVIDTAQAVDTLHKAGCTLCHAYTGSKLDPAAVATAISTGKGLNGTDVSCRTCHTDNRSHHDSPDAANNNCAITCHTAVDHSSAVSPSTACASCHTATAGTATGLPTSLSDAAIHNACRTCHTFDTNKRGILVNFTNQKGVNGSGPLPNGGSCINCHTANTISTYHHSNTRTAAGQCETCHADPRTSWGPNSPGDNGTASGLPQARPTQMACVKCHVAFTGSNMTVTKFTRTDYTSYRNNWTKTIAHTIPMPGSRINNYGICLSCHSYGNSKVPESAWVTLWHAHPSRFGGTYWTFYNQGWTDEQGKSASRGSGSKNDTPPGDRAHYLPGRSKSQENFLGPQSGIAGFNLFADNYGGKASYIYSYHNSLGTGMDFYSFRAPAYDTPSFIRVTIPETIHLGYPASATLNDTTRAVPVFASITPSSVTPASADNVKIKSAIYDGNSSTLTVAASTSGTCTDLQAVYADNQVGMTGTASHCTATINNPTYPASGTTVDVTTSNSLGLDVLGYPIATANPGTIAFSSLHYSVAENGGAATITVSRKGGSSGAATINYATANGTATAGSDYTATSGTLTFNSGETDKTFSITTNNDTTPEIDETVNLTLSTPTGGAALGLPKTAQLTIADNDLLAGTIALSQPTYTVSEDAGTATITVNRTGSATGAVSVNYSTNPFGSTAKDGSNYLYSTGTLTWEDGQIGSQTFTIPILANSVAVQNTSLNIYINNPTGGAQLGNPNTAVVNITTPAVAVLNEWSTPAQLIGTTGNLSGSYSIGSGPNRLLLLAVSSKANAGTTGQTFSATYGGKPLTQASIQNSSNYQTWIGYLTEVDIANRSGNGVSVTISGDHTGVVTSIGSYQNVNQINPIAASSGNSAPTIAQYLGAGWYSNTSTVNTAPLLVGPGGYSIYNWSSGGTWYNDTESYTMRQSYNASGIKGGVAAKPIPSPISTNPTVNWDGQYGSGTSHAVASSGITLNSYAGTVAFALTSSTYSIKENAGEAIITASRLGSAIGQASVHYASAPPPRMPPGYIPSFAIVSGDLTWNDGDMGDKSFTVAVFDNTVADSDRPANLQLTAPTNGAILGTPNTAVLTIVNNDAGLAFSASTYTVSENGSQVTITVSRTNSSTEAVSVHYATTAGGTATPVTDYLPVDDILTWAAGDMTAKTFTITINDNLNFTGDRTINLALSNPTGDAVLGSKNTAVLTIAEDESALSLSASTYSIKEGAGPATITIVRQGTSNGALSINYALTANTATAGIDFNAAASGTVSWAEGDLTAKTITIPIIDDTEPEENETLAVTLSNLIGDAFLLTPNSAVLTIADNDHPGTIALTSATYLVDEESATGMATITVRRTGGADGAASVHYASSSSTATDWELDYYDSYWDYHLHPNAGTISWEDGDMADKTLYVFINPDNRWEGNEDMNLVLTPLSGLASLGSPSAAVLTIVDDEDRPGTIALSASAYSVDEDAGSATITVSRRGGYNGAVTAHYATTSSGTASAGSDYAATSGTLSWATGDTSDKTFTVSILNNTQQAANKTVALELTSPTGGATLDAAQNTATLTIIDDEAKPGSIKLAPDSYSAQENVGTVTITAVRSGGSSGAVSVHYAIDDNGSSATAGSDFQTTSGDLYWGDGETGNKTFTITILPDQESEGDEAIVFNLSNPTGGANLAGQTQGVLTIVSPAIEVLDAWPSTPQILGSGPSLSGDFVIGSAPNRLLLVAISSNVSAPNGQTFSVSYGGKALSEATTQHTSTGTWIGYLTEADINSRVGDTVEISVNGAYEVLGASIASYSNVNQTNPIAGRSGSTNTNSTWFTYTNLAVTPSPLTVPAGGYAIYNWTNKSSATRTSDNENYTEHAEFYANELRGGVASKAFVGTGSTKPICTWADVNQNLTYVTSSIITLNKFSETLPASLSLSAPSYRINENSGSATIHVSRAGSNLGAVAVNFATTDSGSATAGVDFTPTSGTLSWAEGDMHDKTFTIGINDNQTYHLDKTIGLELSSPSGEHATLAAPSAALLTITDDEPEPPVTIAFSNSAYSANENDGTATISVSRSGGMRQAVDVSYETNGGDAQVGTHYFATSGTLHWDANDMANKTFTVSIIDNATYSTINRRVGLLLKNPTGGATLGTPVSVQLTILENEVPALISFTASEYSVNENEVTGKATFTVRRTGNSVGAVQVYYQTDDGVGTAVQPTDYQWTWGYLHWADGDTTDKTFTVDIVDNSAIAPDKTVAVSLYPVNMGNATLGTPASVTLTIINDDLPPPNTVALSASAYSVNENAGTASINVSRTGDFIGAACVNYETTATGTASAGSDYTAVSGSLCWADGDMTDKTFAIPIIDNSTYSADKTVGLRLPSASGGTTILGSPNTALLTIVNDDATLSFRSPTYSVNENGGTATITVSRAGSSVGVVGVSYATTSGGSAIADVDYSTTSGLLSWADGDMTDKSFTIPIINNSTYAPNKTINLALTSPTGTATIQGVTNTSVVTIVEDDISTAIVFNSPTYTVHENDGTVTITASRIGSSTGMVVVSWWIMIDSGTATYLSDYGDPGGSIHFMWADGDMSDKTATIPIIDDSIAEGTETVDLMLVWENGPPGADLGVPSSAVLTILDND